MFLLWQECTKVQIVHQKLHFILAPNTSQTWLGLRQSKGILQPFTQIIIQNMLLLSIFQCGNCNTLCMNNIHSHIFFVFFSFFSIINSRTIQVTLHVDVNNNVKATVKLMALKWIIDFTLKLYFYHRVVVLMFPTGTDFYFISNWLSNTYQYKSNQYNTLMIHLCQRNEFKTT